MRPSAVRSAALPAAAVTMVGLAWGCARQGAPTGGDPDRIPPVVVSTRPDTFQVLDAVDDPIRIEFSERISERPTSGTLDDAVLVSPRTGEVRVDHGRSSIEVDLSGGFRPGLVYRVTVLPVIQDMFNNPLREPFEFVFSTGGEFFATAVAGLVLDRLTGRPVEDARVVARATSGDTSVVYVSRTDTSGIFALRFLPPAEYEVVAFTDADRDFRADSFEVQGREVVTLADTVLTDLVILQPDTLPARLARVEPLDSAVLRLVFDDYVEPLMDPEGARVTLEPDSTTPADAPPPPGVVRVFHPPAWEAWRDSVQAVADSVAADSAAAADTAAADTARAPRQPQGPGAGPGVGRTTAGPESLLDVPLPEQELVVLLDAELPAGLPYRVTVAGVTNVYGLTGGGGSVLVRREEVEVPPDTTGAALDTTGAALDTTGAALDSAAVPPDTTGARADTAAAPPDTAGAPPDTTGAPPDTTGLPPDTTVLPPDTMGAPPDTSGVAAGEPSPPGAPPRGAAGRPPGSRR